MCTQLRGKLTSVRSMINTYLKPTTFQGTICLDTRLRGACCRRRWRLAPWRCSLSSPRSGRPVPQQRAPIKMQAPTTGEGYACSSSSSPIPAPSARSRSTAECPPTCAAYAAPLSAPLLAICKLLSLRCARYAPASVERTDHQAWPDQRCRKSEPVMTCDCSLLKRSKAYSLGSLQRMAPR